MTEEEKKAIVCLKTVVDDINECDVEYYIDKDILNDIQTLLKIIERLQVAIIDYQDMLDNSIPKDKIREKIQELDSEFDKRNAHEEDFNFNYSEVYGFATDTLRELLEEE